MMTSELIRPAHLRFLALAVLAAAFGPATALVGPALVSPAWADTGPGTTRAVLKGSRNL